MGNQRRTKKQPSKFLGTYTLPSNQTVSENCGSRVSCTVLKMHSDEFLAPVEAASCVKGTAYSGENFTLIDCHSPGIAHTSFKDEPTRYHADVFPHYVAIGGRHIEPSQPCIKAIHFTTTDLTTLFYDFDAFGQVIDARPVIDVVLQERRQMRPVEAGEWPQVFYFTGKDCIAEVPTAIGNVSIHHRPHYNMGGPSGVFIKNHIVVSIEHERPATFHESISFRRTLCLWLPICPTTWRLHETHATRCFVNTLQESIATALFRILLGSVSLLFSRRSPIESLSLNQDSEDGFQT